MPSLSFRSLSASHRTSTNTKSISAPLVALGVGLASVGRATDATLAQEVIERRDMKRSKSACSALVSSSTLSLAPTGLGMVMARPASAASSRESADSRCHSASSSMSESSAMSFSSIESEVEMKHGGYSNKSDNALEEDLVRALEETLQDEEECNRNTRRMFLERQQEEKEQRENDEVLLPPKPEITISTPPQLARRSHVRRRRAETHPPNFPSFSSSSASSSMATVDLRRATSPSPSVSTTRSSLTLHTVPTKNNTRRRRAHSSIAALGPARSATFPASAFPSPGLPPPSYPLPPLPLPPTMAEMRGIENLVMDSPTVPKGLMGREEKGGDRREVVRLAFGVDGF